MDRPKRTDFDDSPTYSRLFVVCDRKFKEEDFREAFSKFGTIEDIRMPRHHKTGEAKGVVYIQFSKTSEAAAALEEMHQTVMSSGTRPLKVMVACNRSEIQSDEDDDDKYKRLFISIPKDFTETDIENHFGQFGRIVHINIQRDRDSRESKGFAYVKFRSFLDAALAFESSDKKYRAIFAQPKGFNKRHETNYESNINNLANSSANMRSSLLPYMNTRPEGFTRVNYMCSPYLSQHQVARIFDIVPGMAVCKFYIDRNRNCAQGTVSYTNPISAAYAVEKLNGLEYPPCSPIFVKPDYANFDFNHHDFNSKLPETVNNLQKAISAATSSNGSDLAQLAEAIAKASQLIKVATAGVTDDIIPDSNDLNYCSVKLPPPMPLADIDSTVAKRCFLVCKPQPPPLTVLRDVFCRFGNLINVYTLPNKTVGYARYATVESAESAMKVLHGAEICGVRIKVLEADEEAPPKRMRYN